MMSDKNYSDVLEKGAEKCEKFGRIKQGSPSPKSIQWWGSLFASIYRHYPSISIFSPDFSSTVKWSSQTVICLSQRLTKVSSNSARSIRCCLMKSCRSLILAICASLAAVSTVYFFTLFAEFEKSGQQFHRRLLCC